MKIMHIITGLGVGGAEVMLNRIVSKTDKKEIQTIVISLTEKNIIGGIIEKEGIEVIPLNMKTGKFSFQKFISLTRIIKKYKPDIIQTWMYHSDMLGGIAGFISGKPVIWGIHHSNLDKRVNKKSTLIVTKICAVLSWITPKKIICCSTAAYNVHKAIGYNSKKMVIIPNGFEIDKYKPNEAAGRDIRKIFGIEEKTMIVGLIARFDPLKGHLNFIKAAGKIVKEFKNVKFIFCGDKIDEENEKLMSWVKSEGITDFSLFLGRRDDLNIIMPGLDLLVSSSVGEAFPLVVGEAMSCGVPCVVTNVGDSAFLVGSTGEVVEPENSEELSNKILKFLRMHRGERVKLGKMARERVVDNFDIEKILKKYIEVYKGIL